MARIPPRGRAGAAILLFLALFLISGVVFALENFQGTSGGAPPAPRGAAGDRDFGALLGVVLLIPFAFALAALVFFLTEAGGRSAPRGGRIRPSLPRMSRRTALHLGLVFGFVALFWLVEFGPGSRSRSLYGPGDSGSATGSMFPGGSFLKEILGRVGGFGDLLFNGAFTIGTLVSTIPFPIIPLLLMVAVEGFLVGMILRRRARSRERAMRSKPTAGSVPDAPTTEISFGTDVRSSIVRCFWDFCRLLEHAGVSRREPLSPREIEGLAVDVFGVSRDAAHGLTNLFEEARYSEHPMHEGDRAQAEDHLAGIRRGFAGWAVGFPPASRHARTRRAAWARSSSSKTVARA